MISRAVPFLHAGEAAQQGLKGNNLLIRDCAQFLIGSCHSLYFGLLVSQNFAFLSSFYAR